MPNVKGVLFADYVRMLRSFKGVDWQEHITAEDQAYLAVRVESDHWYPMATFERLGNAILRTVARGDLQAVRIWGRFSVDQLRALHPALVAPRDAVETLNRFRVLRSTFFDFEALAITMLLDGEANITIAYGMGPVAEEAASFQTMGFFERLLELSGAEQVSARFVQRSWTGDPRTLLHLAWTIPQP